jgi:hypothetical protein
MASFAHFPSHSQELRLLHRFSGGKLKKKCRHRPVFDVKGGGQQQVYGLFG